MNSDFVTNSSSASFFLDIKSKWKTKDTFEKYFNKYIDSYVYSMRWDESFTGPRFWQPYNISQNKNDKYIFCIEDNVSMYNDWRDIPRYMLDLLFKFHEQDFKFLERFGFLDLHDFLIERK